MLRKSNRWPQSLAILLIMSLSAAAAARYPSAADCAAEADRASRSQGSVLGGAARGATRGAVFGAIVGDSKRDTRRGARLGAVVGTARRASRKNNVYQRVYDDCMRY